MQIGRFYRCAFVILSVVGPALVAGCGSGDTPGGSPQLATTTAQSPKAAASPLTAGDKSPGSDFVSTPEGWFHKDCGVQVPDKSTIISEADGSLRVEKDGVVINRVPKCQHPPKLSPRFRAHAQPSASSEPPAINGWLEFSSFNAPPNPSGTYYTELTGQWTVPPAPTTNGPTLYFFNGLQPSDGSRILQPVLQWGPSPAGGGFSWGIAAWFVRSDGTFAASTVAQVSSGDALAGTVSALGCDPSANGHCTYLIGAADDTTSIGRSIQSDGDNFAYTMAFPAVLEVQNAGGLTNCSQLPNTTSMAFSQTYLYEPGPGNPTCFCNEVATSGTWGTSVDTTDSPQCGYGVSNFSRGTTLSF